MKLSELNTFQYLENDDIFHIIDQIKVKKYRCEWQCHLKLKVLLKSSNSRQKPISCAETVFLRDNPPIKCSQGNKYANNF